MQLAGITAVRKRFVFFLSLLTVGCFSLQAQDNSPYSRYGLGNEAPRTNVINRAMGGISAGYTDITSVNYANPASYARFFVYTEPRSGKVSSGRVILDAGVNLTNRTLSQPNTANSFNSSDLLFSHVYVGIPIRKNWGLAFGLRPLSRVTYNNFRRERLFGTGGTNIDSAVTQFNGNGGSFLPTIGTGFGNNKLSVGFNVGYLFGRKEVSARRAFVNDSVEYAASNQTNNSSFGGIFFNTGIQYTLDLRQKDSAGRRSGIQKSLTIGGSGNWRQTLTGTQDLLRQTYVRNANGLELQVDSVFQQNDVDGDVIYPATYTAGIWYERGADAKARGFGIGLDYTASRWNDFRFFGARDLVKNSSEIRLGVQLSPVTQPTRYGQALSLRFGAFTGTDYIAVDNELPVFGVSAGLGLPIRPSRQSPNQFSVINLAVEYSRRGNDDNRIRESLLRFSLGLNFTDLWFGKRKYD